MTITRKLITASATFVLCMSHLALEARQLPGDSGVQKGTTPLDLKFCVREVDRSVASSGTDSVQYITRFIKVKNFCGKTLNVTLDVAYQRDPKCERIKPGKTAEFVYGVSLQQPPPHEYRRVKSC